MTLKYPFIVPVNGITFHKEYAMNAKQGMKVVIMHEANKYDELAFEIKLNDKRIGYLPKQLSHRLYSQGKRKMHGIVSQVLDTENGFGLRIKITSDI